MSGMADLLLRLLGRSNAITKADVAYAIESELQAKVLALDLHRYTAHDLRENDDMLRSIHDSLRGNLALAISGYGLQLDNFFVNWGLTLEERGSIRRQRHQSTLEHHVADAQPKRSAPDDQKRQPAATTRSVGYWVYEDDPTNMARVHKGTCGYCNHGRGIKGNRLADNRWIGPFETESEAIERGRVTGRADVRGCKICLRSL